MKLKGTLDIRNKKHHYHGFIFVNDYNTLAILYSCIQIDLYDLNTLKF